MIFRLTVNQTYDNQLVQSAWHVFKSSEPDQADVDEFASETHDKFATKLAANLVANNIEIRRVDALGFSSVIWVPAGWPNSGDSGGVDGLPGPMSILVKGQAPGAARPNKIRKYISGVREDHTTRGLLLSAQLTLWQDICDEMTAWQTGTPLLDVMSVRYSTGADPVVEASNHIELFTVTDVLAVQRRRKIGVGQ